MIVTLLALSVWHIWTLIERLRVRANRMTHALSILCNRVALQPGPTGEQLYTLWNERYKGQGRTTARMADDLGMSVDLVTDLIDNRPWTYTDGQAALRPEYEAAKAWLYSSYQSADGYGYIEGGILSGDLVSLDGGTVWLFVSAFDGDGELFLQSFTSPLAPRKGVATSIVTHHIPADGRWVPADAEQAAP